MPQTVKRWGPGAMRVFRAGVKRVQAATRSAGKAAHSLARQLVPKRTKALWRSIKFVEGYRNGRYFFAIVIGEFYWVFVEYGTVNQDAQPFVRPAVEEGRRMLREKRRLLMGKTDGG